MPIRRWTKEDHEFLRLNAQAMKTKELARRLNRSVVSIRARASVYGWPMRNLYKYMGCTRRKQQGVVATRQPTTAELHWIAGFLEGEGCFRFSSTTEHSNAKQVSREPLDRLQSLVGGAIRPHSHALQRARGGKGKDGWTWYVSGARARGIMMTLYPLLSTRRQGQVRTALGARLDPAVCARA